METRIAYNYDDFDKVKLEGENSGAGLFSPFTFICFTFFIVLYGLLSLYSASFDLAVRNGFEHYHYLVKQAQGVVLGLAIGILSRLLPIKLIKRSYYFLTPLAIGVLVLMLNPMFNVDGIFYINGIRIVSGSMLAIFASIMLVAGTTQSIKNLGERHGIYYGAVYIAILAIAILTAFTSGIGCYFLLAIVVVSMMHASGAGKGYSVLLFLFLLASGLFLLFVNKEFLSQVLYAFMPVLDGRFYNSELITSQMAIKDGGLLGTGIGHGLYKLGILDGVENQFIFSSLCEETGVIGVMGLFLMLLGYVFLGIRASQRAFKKNSFWISGASIGISMFVLFAAAFNAMYVCGLIPIFGVPFPFFSYGPGEEALFVFMSVIQYRFIHLMGRPHEKA